MIAAILALSSRFSHGTASRLRNLYYRSLGVNLRGYVWLRKIEIPRNWADITVEEHVALDTGVTLLCSGPSQDSKLIIRSGTYVNRYTMFDAHQRIEVGRNCMIGPSCYITDGNHGLAAKRPVKEQPMRSTPVIIEDEVWLGAHVTILPGVNIGRGAVIGAGSVVTADIPAMMIAVGVPAKVIKQRV